MLGWGRAISAVGRTVRIGVDSGAELSVWPEGLFAETPLVPNDDSAAGVMYWGPGDIDQPSIRDLGSRSFELLIGGKARQMKPHIAQVRKPLLAVCDLNDKGHDVHFMCDGRAWAEHRATGEVTQFERVGGRYEIVAEVVRPSGPPGRGSRL